MSLDALAVLKPKVRAKLPADREIRGAFPCSLEGRQAVLVVAEESAYLFALGGRMTENSAPILSTFCMPTGEVTATVRLHGQYFNLVFDSAHLLATVGRTIGEAIERAKDAAETRRRQRLGLPLEWFRLGPNERLMASWTYLGGANLRLAEGVNVDVLFGTDDVRLYRLPSSPAHEPVVRLPYGAGFELALSGPGRFKTGGGYIGGGAGLMGAAEGMAVASLLNSLTTRTHVQSVIAMVSTDYEAFFLSQEHAPDELRRLLAPVFLRSRQDSSPSAHMSVEGAADPSPATPASSTPVGALDGGDLVTRLERLAALHRAGALTDDEFAAAKARALGL